MKLAKRGLPLLSVTVALMHLQTSWSFAPTKSFTVRELRTNSISLSFTIDDDESSMVSSEFNTNDDAPLRESRTAEEGDQLIRDELKRELLLLSSVTSRGDFADPEERAILNDIVTQLEALNPSTNQASECAGEWDLTLTSTQAFRSSPFFQAIRSILNDEISADNAFKMHEQATSMGRISRVRQFISENGTFVSEADLKVGPASGTVVTKANFEITNTVSWDVKVESTQVKNSNILFLDQILESLELPVGLLYQNVRGSVPVSKLTHWYVDETMRIARDVDDNYYVFSRV
jgi:hypothetical protein